MAILVVAYVHSCRIRSLKTELNFGLLFSETRKIGLICMVYLKNPSAVAETFVRVVGIWFSNSVDSATTSMIRSMKVYSFKGASLTAALGCRPHSHEPKNRHDRGPHVSRPNSKSTYVLPGSDSADKHFRAAFISSKAFRNFPLEFLRACVKAGERSSH